MRGTYARTESGDSKLDEHEERRRSIYSDISLGSSSLTRVLFADGGQRATEARERERERRGHALSRDIINSARGWEKLWTRAFADEYANDRETGGGREGEEKVAPPRDPVTSSSSSSGRVVYAAGSAAA